MSVPSAHTRLLASKELILSICQQHTSLPSEEHVHLLEALEHLEHVEPYFRELNRS